jgi:hypothetical protein
MWLMTTQGFYSIVRKNVGTYHVRARERNDLVNLKRVCGFDDEAFPIHESKQTDYGYRLIVAQSSVQHIMDTLGLYIEYDNFKTEIGNTPDQRHKLPAYHEVWAVMSDLLGGYGKRGTHRRR